MQRKYVLVPFVMGAVAALSFAQATLAQAQPQSLPPKSRRSQRVNMQEVQVASPNGKIKFTILPNAERLAFTVTMGNTVVIEPSSIAMKVDGYDLSSGVDFNNLERYSIDESYPWYGAHSTAVNQCNGAKISLTHDLSFTTYTLEVRAFNDGVAYRHVIPGDESTVHAPDEYSAFVIPDGSTLWYGGLAGGHYETEYLQKNIAEVHAGEWAGPPLTFKLPLDAGYASITEADLVNYSGMGLEADGRRGWITGLGHRHPLNWPFELRYGRDEARRLGKPASITGTITTPWRVVMVGRDLNSLVNSTILPNLCPPPDPKLFSEGIHTSWINPGRAVWRYLDDGPEGVEGMKEFSRLAGQLRFEYNVIEGFWSKWTPEQRKEVVGYSQQQGVGLWFWKHSKDLRTPEAREEFFKMLRDTGVVGAKIDFFDHEAKEVIDLYEALLQKAAEYHILLVFHGANKPTGRQRTWPNELVREAIRGMESSALKERAKHETILPFTRLLAGPADYTAMLFNDRRRDSTVAHQIASIAVFDAPLLTIAANPQTILHNPAAEVIKSVPPIWDETIVLSSSEIGELAAFARRKGDTWFLALMCGPQAKTIHVPLSFLSDGQYKSVQIRDSPADDANLEIENGIHKRNDSLTIELRVGGGFLGRFSRSQ
ncbi:MAG TPA: glycoside hydrolase family 97 N-terminal domain-containing protein [Candidatus Acidoferrum sp.]|nr:glycoside hydrolase family 97 N-terminal domain-containing protein [Candidatus Acidoferrum sp.]